VTLTYDLDHDVAYIRLGVPGGSVATVRVSDDVNVDLAADGTVYGIELLHAAVQLGADAGRLVVLDEGHGERRTIALR
jgi:uncharacterized protein YuzE